MALRPDSSQNYALKIAFEQIFGNEAWLKLKETTSLVVWREYVAKLFKAIRISIEESIEIHDEQWFDEIEALLDRGIELIRVAKDIEELTSCLSATLMKLVFLQIGQLPTNGNLSKVTLARENWRLNSYRSVQYIQSPKQFEAYFWSKQQKEVGFDKQIDLWRKYKSLKTKKRFSQWCREETA